MAKPFYSKLRYFVLAISLACANACFADVRFKHLTMQDGLSADLVYTVLQDKQGYIWFGTETGLDRYDGYTFKVFKHDPADPNSLSANLVKTLCEDAQGRLWIGTYGGGLDLYEPATNSFRHYSHDKTDANSIASNRVWSLALEANGSLLIGTFDAGLDVFDPQSGKFRHYRGSLGEPAPGADRINSIFVDRQGIAWLATEAGLDSFELGSARMTHYQDANTQKDSNVLWGVAEDSAHRLWLATQSSGPRLLLPGRTSSISPQGIVDMPASFARSNIRSIVVDSKNNMWIGSVDSGLSVIPNGEHKAINFHKVFDKADSLSSNTVWDVYEDRGGFIWVATDSGVNLIDPNILEIHSPTLIDNNSNELSASNKIFAVTEYQHKLLVGSTTGIYSVPIDTPTDFETSTGSVVLHIDATRFGHAKSILDEGDKGLLVGTERGYLFEINPRMQVRKVWRIGQELGLTGRTINHILREGEDFLYLATFGNGVLKFNTRTSATTPIAGTGTDQLLPDDLVEDMVRDKHNRLWVATFRGLFQIDLSTDRSKLIRLEPNGNEPIIQAIHIDAIGNIWVGTLDGLWELKGAAESNRDSPPISILRHMSILSIEQDEKHYLWLAGVNLLMRFNPVTGETLQFGRDQGSPVTEYYSYAHAHTSNGILWFGGTDGIIGFDPMKFKPNTRPPDLVINSLTVYRHGKPTDISLYGGATPRLHYDDTIITLDLAALDFGAPHANTFSYRVAGLQSEWTPPSTAHQITFTNLNPGSYQLEVRAANNWGTWSAHPIGISIVVLPPWWRTWWAYTLYVLIIISSITSYVYSLQRKIRREKEISASLREANELKTHFMEELESQVKKATHDLRETLQGVNLKNAELEVAQKRAAEGEQIKSQFLANMSHELRTPLTGVLGYTKLLAATPLTSEQKDFIGTIRQSSESLLAIINDTLDLSRLEAGKLLVDEVDFDLLEVIESTLELLAPIAYQKRLELVRIVPADVPLQLRGDPLRLRQILTNLLSNAIKFTESGSVSLRASLVSQNEREAQLAIVVTDSGIGIPESELPKLFHAYARSRISVTRQVEGTGLGLAICKKLLDLMGGKIHVSSKLGGGSSFELQLPFRLQKNQQPRRQLPGRPQILLYDAHPLSSQAWEASLTRMGAHVRRATDLEEAAADNADAALIVLTDKDMVQLTDLHAKLTHGMPPALILAPRMDRPTLTHVSETLFHRVLSKAAREGAVLIELQSLVQTALPHAADTARLVQPPKTLPDAGAPLILVTDDNRINRRLLVTMLHQAGMRAAEAASGLELIQLAQKGPWNAALVDIHMPGMDGIEAAERLYKLFGDDLPPVIAMSADVMPETRKQVLSGIICDFLMKPFNEQQLIETLRKHLDKHATRLQAAANAP